MWELKNEVLRVVHSYRLSVPTRTHTNRAIGSDGGQQYSTQSPPGCSYKERRDEDSSRHSQTVRPTSQEEISQSEQAQGQRIVGSCETE